MVVSSSLSVTAADLLQGEFVLCRRRRDDRVFRDVEHGLTVVVWSVNALLAPCTIYLEAAKPAVTKDKMMHCKGCLCTTRTRAPRSMVAAASSALVPTPVVPISLRSGFFALPFLTGTGALHWIYARAHKAGTEEDAAEETDEPCKLFITGIPLPASAKAVRASLGAVYPGNKVVKVQMLPGESPIATLLARENLASTSTILPLFDAPDSTVLPLAPCSAIVTFTSSAVLPPTSISASSTPKWISPATSYLASSKARHSLARPHLSSIVAHSDSWMTAYDTGLKTKSAESFKQAVLDHGIVEFTPVVGKKGKKGKKSKVDEGPLPGSAAYALAQHIASTTQLANRAYNPDEVVEEEWKLVTRGGQHGKSMLPAGNAGVTIDLHGYGGANVGVARKRRLGEGEPEGEPQKDGEQHKIIVGEGFYRFRREDTKKTRASLVHCRSSTDVSQNSPTSRQSSRRTRSAWASSASGSTPTMGTTRSSRGARGSEGASAVTIGGGAVGDAAAVIGGVAGVGGVEAGAIEAAEGAAGRRAAASSRTELQGTFYILVLTTCDDRYSLLFCSSARLLSRISWINSTCCSCPGRFSSNAGFLP